MKISMLLDRKPNNIFNNQLRTGLAATFRVTSTLAVKTAADRRLANNDSVLRMLKWIESHMTKRKPRLSSRNSSSVLETMDEVQQSQLSA